MALPAIAAAAIPAVMGIIDKLSPSSSTSQQSTLTNQQEGILSSLAGGSGQAINELYGTLGQQSRDASNSYQALPDFEGQFQQQYAQPLRQQYEMDLANLSHSPELFSGGNLSGGFRAMRNLNTNLASARSGMMMQERERQRQSAEASYGRQLQASGLLSNLGTAGLNVRATENLTSATPSWLGTLGNIGSASGNIAQGLQGLGGSSAGAPNNSTGPA